MESGPDFVREWLGRLCRTPGIAAIQILHVTTGEVLLPPHGRSPETPEEGKRRAAAVLRSISSSDEEAVDEFAVVPPDWRTRLEDDEHAIYQARVGEDRILEALVRSETQAVEDLLETTVEQLEEHFAAAEGGT